MDSIFLGCSLLTDPSMVAVLRDQTLVIMLLSEALLEALDWIELWHVFAMQF